MLSEYPGIFFGSRSSGIKKSKPAMEKRRRARINASLAELRSLIPESVKRGNRRCSKMEKADILELAVSYLRHLQDASKDKGQVSKTSYSLGFSECTQEVSQFFRSTSPSTSTIKGSLLEHLNGCAPDHHPDSPSSSVVKSVLTSTNGFFKTSSIIARCLLSSTMVVTPEKISGYTRHSNTPGAVSSTSDTDSSEVTVDAQDPGDPSRLDTGTEILKPVENEALDVQRLEVFKVKKDLINSFNNEPQENQNSPSKPRNYTTSNDNLDQSSTTVTLLENAGFNDTNKEKIIQDKNEDDDAFLPIIVNSGELTNHAVANVCSQLSPTKTNESIVEATLLNKNEELLLPDRLIPIKTSSSNAQMPTQTNEKTDAKIDKPAANTNNSSLISSAEETETHQINPLSTKAHSNFDSTPSKELSDNAHESSFISTISPVADHDRSMGNQTQTYILPLEIPATEFACSDFAISKKTAASELQRRSVPLDLIQNYDKTGCLQHNASQICITTENPSAIPPKVSSFLIPAYVQASLDREIPSLQQATLLKSPTRTNIIVPVNHAMFTSTIPTVKEEMATGDSRAVNSNNSTRCDVQLCSSNVSAAEYPLELSPLHANSNICVEFSTLRLPECRTDSQADSKESNTIPNLQTTGNKESILPIITSPYLIENMSNIKENDNPKTNTINSLVHVSKTTNFSTLLLNPVNSTNLTSFSRKRPLTEGDTLNEKKPDGCEKSRSENLDNPKQIRLSPTNLLHSTPYQDSGCTNETLRQYMATKFRPIAPKNMIIRNVDSENANNLQQKVNASQLSLKAAPGNNNVNASMFRSSNIFCQTSNMKIDKDHISNNNSVFSSSGGNHQLLAQCGNVQSFINKESTQTSSKVDDILTTVLKSSIPLDKTLFEAKRMNTSKANQNWSSAEPKTLTKHQNEDLNHRSLPNIHANLNSLCQSNNKNKSPTQTITFTDQETIFQCQNQHCEVEKEEGNVCGSPLMSLGDDRNVSLHPSDKHPHYNVSAILRELCQRCQLSGDDSRTNISEDLRCIPAEEYKRGLVAGTSRNLSPVSSQHGRGSDMNTEKWNSFPHHDRGCEMKTNRWNPSPQHDGDSKMRTEKWNTSPRHDQDSEIKTNRWNPSHQHDRDSKMRTEKWNTSHGHDQDSDRKTEKFNSSPQHSRDRDVKTERWNLSLQHSRDRDTKTEMCNTSPQHDRKSDMKEEGLNFFPIDLTISQQRYSCMNRAEDILEKGHFLVIESSQNKIIASDNGTTSTKNEQNVISSELNIQVKNSISTNKIQDKLSLALAQPLNLSLRDHDRVTKKLQFQDKEPTDKDYTLGLDLSLRNVIKTPESTLNSVQSSPASQTSVQSDNENDSLTMTSYKQASLQSDNRSQKKEAYPTNSNNLPISLSSAVFSQTEQGKDSKASPGKDSNLYHRTNIECTSYLAADIDTLSRHTFMPTFSSKAAKQIEFANCSENLQHTPRTSLDSNLCSPSFNQNCQLLSERSIKTMLPYLSHVYHNPGDTAGVSDDVWRPW